VTLGADDLKLLLLDMISSARIADTGAMRKVGEAEWRTFAWMSRQHRLEPLLHHRAHVDWPIPAALRESWARSYRRSAFRALSIRQTMGFVASSLAHAQIPYAILKGAWLSWQAYEHSALRPMRDLDIIVPPDLARDAYIALATVGFVPRKPHEPSIDFAMEHGKHLPGLVHPRTAVSVEVHHRLTSPKMPGNAAAIQTAELLSRSGCFGSEQEKFRCLAPTDTLLHLIIHAVYEHKLCNGPLVLSDISCVLRAAKIDWRRFWSLAEHGGWVDGARLILSLVERYHGSGQVAWPQHVTKAPEQMIEIGALMMLQDHEQRGRLDLVAKLESAGGWIPTLRLVLERTCPERHALAAYARRPVQARDLWRYYPGWALSRLAAVIRSLLSARMRSELPRTRLLKAWLRD